MKKTITFTHKIIGEGKIPIVVLFNDKENSVTRVAYSGETVWKKPRKKLTPKPLKDKK